MTAGTDPAEHPTCDLCGEDGEIHFSEQLDAWCCFECYDRPTPATDRQLRYLNRLRRARGLKALDAITFAGAKAAIDQLRGR